MQASMVTAREDIVRLTERGKSEKQDSDRLFGALVEVKAELQGLRGQLRDVERRLDRMGGP